MKHILLAVALAGLVFAIPAHHKTAGAHKVPTVNVVQYADTNVTAVPALVPQFAACLIDRHLAVVVEADHPATVAKTWKVPAADAWAYNHYGAIGFADPGQVKTAGLAATAAYVKSITFEGANYALLDRVVHYGLDVAALGSAWTGSGALQGAAFTG